MNIQSWNIDIDSWLNPYIPRNQLSKFPTPVSRYLGYRDKPQYKIGNVLVAWWACVGAFTGVIIIEAVLMIPAINDLGVPIVIASFVSSQISHRRRSRFDRADQYQGAAAILEYNFISSPLAQPRNGLFGHFFSALVGVGVTKLFMLSSNFENLRWLAGALACGLASAVMTLTETVYPPAGATALLAAVDPTLSQLGWYLVPLVLLSAVLTLVSSLLINNIQRQYPLYWWTAADLRKKTSDTDIEKIPPSISGASSTSTGMTQHEDVVGPVIRIFPSDILVPESISLSREETAVLEVLRNRLRDTRSHAPDGT